MAVTRILQRQKRLFEEVPGLCRTTSVVPANRQALPDLFFPSLRTGNFDRIYSFRASEPAISTEFTLSEPANGQSRPDLRFLSLRMDNRDRIYSFSACEQAISTGFILSELQNRQFRPNLFFPQLWNGQFRQVFMQIKLFITIKNRRFYE
jgi:hypothetical protein